MMSVMVTVPSRSMLEEVRGMIVDARLAEQDARERQASKNLWAYFIFV
jgi:hypothetical protein